MSVTVLFVFGYGEGDGCEGDDAAEEPAYALLVAFRGSEMGFDFEQKVGGKGVGTI